MELETDITYTNYILDDRSKRINLFYHENYFDFISSVSSLNVKLHTNAIMRSMNEIIFVNCVLNVNAKLKTNRINVIGANLSVETCFG